MIIMKKIMKIFRQNKFRIVFVTILLVAGIIRFYNLQWEALAWNEGTLLGGSKEYLKGNFLYNFNDFATPPLVKYFGTIVLYFFGFSEFFLRSIGVIFGLGTIILTYLLARRYYDRNIALFASSILAFSMIHIHFSRTFLAEPVLAFFFIASLYAYLRIVKDGNRKKWPVIFGICVALELLSKWLAINLIVAILIHAIYSKYIRAGTRKKFSVEIEGWMIKSFIAFVIVFFIIWPMALYPIKLDVNVKVVGMEDRGDTFILNVPTIFLSPSEYFTVALGREEKIADPSILPVMQIPFVGYSLLMFSKESLFFVALFIFGLLAIYKKRRSIDKDIFIFLCIFLLILWFQRYGQTYRYLTVIMPLFAIIAARSLDILKSANTKILVAIISSIILFGTSMAVHPNYNIYYNSIEIPFGFKEIDQEIQNTDGYREGIGFVKANCTKVTGDMAGTIINYVQTPEKWIVENPQKSDLPICVYVSNQFEERTKFVENLEHSIGIQCDMEKEITRGNLRLRRIYICR